MGYLEEEKYTLSFASNGKDALHGAFKKSFDLILLDINMPQMDGFEVIKRLKDDASTKGIPVIFLSAMDDIDSITRAFAEGAVDYISKPFNGLELIARVRTQIELRKYVLELQEKQSKLAKLAATDQLTSLPNRLHFMSTLKKKCKAIVNVPSRLSLAYFKIDHMHKINDLYGYRNGDKIIAKVAKLMGENILKNDFAARIFGGEFVILMSDTSIEAAQSKARKIQRIVADAKILETKITFSIGVSEYKKSQEHEKFVMITERLMEASRKDGGNSISL